MDFKNIGSLIIIFGVITVFVGAVIYFFGGSLSWFGNLPGDIKIEGKNFNFYFPLTTMILVSIFLNIVLRIIFYFFK
ncbi:DUF2905 domain-containing protein [Halanaerobium sp.]|uniref:DUF2905 domain-containing protein n=1 Tax=Halanaerobium sp. TaxID=1895664 RepID=UPI000DE797FF|nr:DUF2905 domain-containing protein [Halanaerobium sp.]PUU92269.1 MAG: hypothetical protein CI949_1686 [Halanaerobium sp.]